MTRIMTYEEQKARRNRNAYQEAFSALLMERDRKLNAVKQWYIEELARLKTQYGVEDKLDAR